MNASNFPRHDIPDSFVWDMHADVNNAPVAEGMGYVGAPFDRAVAALIDDIEARGLRDRIMVVCCGEMGRTPVVNSNGGRDHWGGLAPLLLYGGGLGAGRVVGRSSRDGGQPASDPVSIADLVSLVLNALVDPAEVRLIDGLPRTLHDVLGHGRPIAGLTYRRRCGPARTMPAARPVRAVRPEAIAATTAARGPLPVGLYRVEDDDQEGGERPEEERQEAPEEPAAMLALGEPGVDQGEGAPAHEEIGSSGSFVALTDRFGGGCGVDCRDGHTLYS